jgi:hypothetical protein
MTIRCEEACDKLYETVGRLACSEAPLQSRLAEAWTVLVEKLSPSGLAELPPGLRAKYQEIQRGLTGGNDPVEATIHATCAKMTSDEAGDWICEIVVLYGNASEAFCEAQAAEPEGDRLTLVALRI